MPEELRVEAMELCVTACEKFSSNNEVRQSISVCNETSYHPRSITKSQRSLNNVPLVLKLNVCDNTRSWTLTLVLCRRLAVCVGSESPSIYKLLCRENIFMMSSCIWRDFGWVVEDVTTNDAH